MIRLTFACGHTRSLADNCPDIVPRCTICGEVRVQHIAAPQPRVRGACQSPLKES